MAVKRITVPFANTGEKTEIPLDAQANGSVSREKGFGEHYELPYDNPNAKDIERTIFNQIEFEQDSAIAEMQQHGVSVFSNENSYTYPKGALVFFNGAVYQSLKDNNSDEPTNSSWKNLQATASLNQTGISQLTDKVDSNNVSQPIIGPAVINYFSAQIPAGSTFLWLSETLPSGFLFLRGQAFDKVTNPKLALLFPSGVLPDMRGVVPRGLDAGRGFDIARAVGSYQEDAMQKITGTIGNGADDEGIGIFIASRVTGAFKAGETRAYAIARSGTGASNDRTFLATLDSSLVTRTNTQNETVMKNIAVNFIIKAG